MVNGLADLLPDSYSGDDISVDIEEFLARNKQWLEIHNNRFNNAAEQFVVSRAHTTFAEVTESVKTFPEQIEVDTVSHMFENVPFSDVGCTLCNEPHKFLECPSLCSIIEIEVSSSASPNDSSSSSDS